MPSYTLTPSSYGYTIYGRADCPQCLDFVDFAMSRRCPVRHVDLDEADFEFGEPYVTNLLSDMTGLHPDFVQSRQLEPYVFFKRHYLGEQGLALAYQLCEEGDR
jgi:glutaredoxin